MSVVMEARLRKEAMQKGLTGEQADAYVFGTLAKLKVKSQQGVSPVSGTRPMTVKTANPGLLHQHLGIKVGTSIPLGKLMKAKKSRPFGPAIAARPSGPNSIAGV